MALPDYIEAPVFDDSLITTTRSLWVLKETRKGDPFLSKPVSRQLVSLCDAEFARTSESNKKGIITYFECQKCKRRFRAKTARGLMIYLNSSYFIQRAYCGRCLSDEKVLELERQLEDVINKVLTK